MPQRPAIVPVPPLDPVAESARRQPEEPRLEHAEVRSPLRGVGGGANVAPTWPRRLRSTERSRGSEGLGVDVSDQILESMRRVESKVDGVIQGLGKVESRTAEEAARRDSQDKVITRLEIELGDVRKNIRELEKDRVAKADHAALLQTITTATEAFRLADQQLEARLQAQAESARKNDEAIAEKFEGRAKELTALGQKNDRSILKIMVLAGACATGMTALIEIGLFVVGKFVH